MDHLHKEFLWEFWIGTAGLCSPMFLESSRQMGLPPHHWNEETPPEKAALLTGTQQGHTKNAGGSLCQTAPQEKKKPIAQLACLHDVQQPLKLSMALVQGWSRSKLGKASLKDAQTICKGLSGHHFRVYRDQKDGSWLCNLGFIVLSWRLPSYTTASVRSLMGAYLVHPAGFSCTSGSSMTKEIQGSVQVVSEQLLTWVLCVESNALSILNSLYCRKDSCPRPQARHVFYVLPRQGAC